jgi:multimeric flavodoxin WrbA
MANTLPKIRIGQAPNKLKRAEFSDRFKKPFLDPAFRVEDDAINKLEEIAWHAFIDGRKAPLTQKAGKGYANPSYELSSEWVATKKILEEAQVQWKDSKTKSRVLLICASARNDGTCPSEMSKSFRLMEVAKKILNAAKFEVDILDLSLLTSEYQLHIHPCKGCVSTAMPLCHWPCSCYPNYSLNQTNDWMADIYEKWTSAHGVIIFSPVYWYQSPSPLKLMIDRLVCADGGNPDPTSTLGKEPKLAKKIELEGWDYPKHLAGRAYGLVVHGDVAGVEDSRRALSDWLDWMGFIDSGAQSRLDRYIGYYEPYANSHDILDKDLMVQEEVKNVARSVIKTVKELRKGRLLEVLPNIKRPRPK